MPKIRDVVPPAPKPDYNADILTLFRHVYGGLTGLLCISSQEHESGTETATSDREDVFFLYPDEAKDAAEFARSRGNDVYMSACLLTREGSVASPASVHALHADLDTGKAPANLVPTALLETAPRRTQGYWRLTCAVTPEKAEELNYRLAIACDARRSGATLPQLLRVPNTMNFTRVISRPSRFRHYQEHARVKLLHLHDDRAYDPEELDRILPPLPRNRRRDSVPPRLVDPTADAMDMLRHRFGNQSGYLILGCVRHIPGTKDKDPQDSWLDHSYMYPDSARTALHNAFYWDADGSDVYFSVRLFKGMGRHKDFQVDAVLTLSFDGDEARIPDGFPQPTMEIESSPGHVDPSWRLSAPVTPDRADALGKRIVDYIGADRGSWSSTKVLRIPGTHNHTRPGSPIVKLLRLDAERAVDADELERSLPPLDVAPRLPDAPRAEGVKPLPELNPYARRVLRGELPTRYPDGRLDRSLSLFKMGAVLHEAGADKATIIAALRERDHQLGWHKYCCSLSERDDGDEQYTSIAENAAKPRSRTSPQKAPSRPLESNQGHESPPPSFAPAGAKNTAPEAPGGQQQSAEPARRVARPEQESAELLAELARLTAERETWRERAELAEQDAEGLRRINRAIRQILGLAHLHQEAAVGIADCFEIAAGVARGEQTRDGWIPTSRPSLVSQSGVSPATLYRHHQSLKQRGFLDTRVEDVPGGDSQLLIRHSRRLTTLPELLEDLAALPLLPHEKGYVGDSRGTGSPAGSSDYAANEGGMAREVETELSGNGDPSPANVPLPEGEVGGVITPPVDRSFRAQNERPVPARVAHLSWQKLAPPGSQLDPYRLVRAGAKRAARNKCEWGCGTPPVWWCPATKQYYCEEHAVIGRRRA